MFERLLANFATPGLLVGIGLVMGALYGADRFLATLENREVSAEAGHVYQQGEALIRQGKTAAAIEDFRRAHVLQRDNRYYQLALANAHITAHEPERAVDTLQDALAVDSNDGPANLLMARAMVEEQKPRQAASFFHRAIYGTWPPAEREKPVEARLELVRWLAQNGDEQSLLAEVLPLEEDAKTNDTIAHELPALYLEAGSLQRAEAAYRKLIRDEPQNGEAYGGLAKVEIEKGAYFPAEQNLNAALRFKPNDANLLREVEIARAALSLDPTGRHLTSQEKLTRSKHILALVENVLFACGPPSGISSQVDEAQNLLSGKPAGPATNEMAEARLDLAEKLWKEKLGSCDTSSIQTEALNLLMKKISQQ